MKAKDIEKALVRISPFIIETPLIPAPFLDRKGMRVFLKCEHEQKTNSFKLRGAFSAMTRLSKDEKKRGVVTRSSGNFAQAIAFAGKTLGIEVTIVMSETVSEIKKVRTEQYDPKLFFCKTRKNEEELVEKLTQEKGYIPISSYNHEDVIAGGGTIALEIYQKLPSIKNFFSPLGGGGLMSGTSLYLKEKNPTIQTVAVEPEGASDYAQSLAQKKPVTLQEVHTIADGLRAPSVGALNRPLLEKYVDRVEVVSDEKIVEAMGLLYEKMGLMVEPSAAASVAGLLQSEAQGDTVCILTGGNISKEKFQETLTRQPF